MSSLRLHNLKSAEGHRIIADWEKGQGYVTKMYNGDRPVFNTVHSTEANARAKAAAE